MNSLSCLPNRTHNITCEDYASEMENVKINNLEKYIRVKLGQKIFPTPTRKECLLNNYSCKCNNCKYNESYYTWKKNGHLRLDFDARQFIKNNFKILQLFDEYFDEIRVVVHSYKGFIEAYFISLDDYDKYNYWEQSYENMKFPYIARVDLTRLGSVAIIKTIIDRIQKIKNGCLRFVVIRKLGDCYLNDQITEYYVYKALVASVEGE